jgi:hypothetical protein
LSAQQSNQNKLITTESKQHVSHNPSKPSLLSRLATIAVGYALRPSIISRELRR